MNRVSNPKVSNPKVKYFNISLSTGILVTIVIISAAMHARHFNKDLMGMHVWRQTQTQSTIISFYEEDMNIFNPRRNDRGNGDGIFRMEFPLMQWLVAGTYKIFGNHLIISRIWMFVIGIFSVLGMYKLLKALFDREVPALIGAWAFNFSPSFFYHTINPMPDNLALCLGIWGLAIFFFWLKKGGHFTLVFSGLLLSLSALCKLPFILYFAVPLVYFVIKTYKASSIKTDNTNQIIQPSIPNLQPLIVSAFTILTFMIFPVAWYIMVVPQWEGNGIVQGIFQINGPDSVVIDNFIHHLFITLPELLLNFGSVPFFLAAIYFIFRSKKYKGAIFPLLAVLGLLLLLYVLFELNMIGKSHDYYMFPFLPLLFVLVSYGAYHLYQFKSRLIRLFVLILLLLLPLTAFLRIDQRWNPEKPGFNKDFLIYRDELREAVPKDALCIAGNDLSHFIFFYYIDKRGWGFHADNLDAKQLSRMIEEGAGYLFTDSRKVETKAGIASFLDELVAERGSIRIFKLKQGFQP